MYIRKKGKKPDNMVRLADVICGACFTEFIVSEREYHKMYEDERLSVYCPLCYTWIHINEDAYYDVTERAALRVERGYKP